MRINYKFIIKSNSKENINLINNLIYKKKKTLIGKSILPNKIHYFSVLRSPHVNNKFRRHFVIKTHKQIFILNFLKNKNSSTGVLLFKVYEYIFYLYLIYKLYGTSIKISFKNR